MSLQKAVIPMTTKNVKNSILNSKFTFDNIVQRSLCWERKRKSYLIESMALGYPIPQIYCKKSKDSENGTVYDVLDGKQRLNTIKQFLCDEFALTELPSLHFVSPVSNEEMEIELTGKKFSELPEELQDELNSVSISLVYFDDITKDEEKELFKRLNNGKTLSTKSRTLASCKDIERILAIGEHDIMDFVLSDKARENKNQATIVMKTWEMLNLPIEEVSFESKKFNPIIEQTELTDEQEEEIVKVFDYMYSTYMETNYELNENAEKKLLKETHFISLIPFAKICMDNEVDVMDFARWINDFFGTTETTSISDTYNTSINGGSAKPVNIQNRHNALKESFEKTFSELVEN